MLPMETIRARLWVLFVKIVINSCFLHSVFMICSAARILIGRYFVSRTCEKSFCTL